MSVKKEELGMADQMILVCRRKDGTIKWITDTKTDPIGMKSNSMAKTGMAIVAGLTLLDVAGTAFDFVGIGDSATAESADHTNLQAATNKKYKTATGTRITIAFTNDTARLVATFSSADSLSGTWSVCEAGVFNAVSAGVMLFRKIFTAKSCDWTAGDSLEVTAKCRMKQGT